MDLFQTENNRDNKRLIVMIGIIRDRDLYGAEN